MNDRLHREPAPPSTDVNPPGGTTHSSLAAQDWKAEVGLHELNDSSTPEEKAEVIRKWIAQADLRDNLTNETQREVLRAHGISARMIDAGLRWTVSSSGATVLSTGTATALVDPQPWPHPVDGETLLSQVETTLTEYVSLPDHAATVISLWTVFSHAHDAFDVSPVLAITSPEKRCGKTTLLSMLKCLVPRPLPLSNVTTATLFRAVEKYRPTCLIDEADTYLRKSDELRGILNSGHTRQMAFVARCTGDDYEPTPFSTWAPKAVALIGSLPDTLADRSIEVRMKRRTKGETTKRWRSRLAWSSSPVRHRTEGHAVNRSEGTGWVEETRDDSRSVPTARS